LDQLQSRSYCALGVILMGVRIPEVDQHAVAHVLRHEPAEALDGPSDVFLVGRDDLELKKLQTRFNSLSSRQRQVMELVVAGLSSKGIGIQLKISAKTVENHRAWVMERIGARNLAELVRMAMLMQRGS
jgi:DNA-binding NarL/FixJ family response regulator